MTDLTGAGPLDWFVAGPENQLVGVALRWLLDPERELAGPVFLYGPPGTGKSRLARAAAEHWTGGPGQGHAVFTAAVDFARQLADAIAMQATEDFASRYRRAGLLVTDDVHWLAAKPAAQQELLCTLDELLAAGGHVLLTSRKSPAELTGFLPALLGRCTGGLLVPLAPPGRQARRKLLQRYAQARSCQLPAEVAELLADRIPGTAAELAGVVHKLALASELDGTAITAEAARRLLAERHPLQEPDLATVARATARQFRVPVAELRSASRRQAVVNARATAMYVARNLTQKTLGDIGRYFGGRDRTTVSYACRKVAKLLSADQSLDQTVRQLEAALRGRPPRKRNRTAS